jgi:transmembrane sensor
MTVSHFGDGLAVRPPMAGGQPISERVAEQAAEWLTLFMSGEATEEDRRRWQHWGAAHPDHERAWKHIEAVSRRFKVLEPHAGYQTLSPYAGPKPPPRRKAVKLMLGGGVVGISGMLASRTPAWQQQVADHRTRTGEQRSLTLGDGTRITLNTASALNVRFDGQRRLVRLVSGEIWVATAHALGDGTGAIDARPFVVETSEGRIRALGTRFSVRQLGDHTSVAVLESAVEVTPIAHGMPKMLQAGERATFTRTAVDAATGVTQMDEAWTRGQLIASDMPLGEFLSELGRYRPGVLRCAPEVAGLRVSGVFPLHDTGRVLAALPNVLPVQVRMRTRFWSVVEASK